MSEPIVEVGSRWVHVRTGNVYYVTSHTKGKVGDVWMDGVVYQNPDDGESYWTTRERFLSKFALAV